MFSLEKLRVIAKAKFSDKSKLGDWYKDRLSICKDCPLNSTNKPELTIKEQSMVVVNLGKPTCLGCGCEIAAKASVRAEECGIVHKGHAPLWERLPELKNTNFKDLTITNLSSDKVTLDLEATGIAINYGTVAKGSDSTIKFSLKSKEGPITKVSTAVGCGCTTAGHETENGEAVIQVSYDTVGRQGAAKKIITISYIVNRRKHTMSCTLNINVLK